jgi:hypothetical protein
MLKLRKDLTTNLIRHPITEPDYSGCGRLEHAMSEQQREDQEVVFRRREGEEPLRGRMCVENGIVTVTAPDGRQKSTQLVQKSTKLVRRSTQPGLSPAQSLARRMLYELEKCPSSKHLGQFAARSKGGSGASVE